MDDKSDTKRVLSRFSRDGLSGWRMRGVWRSCFLLPVLIMMFALPLTAQEEAFPIDEDFEGTTLPEGWSVESVKGERQWELKSEGENSFMELRNPGEQSLGFESRLITPVIDITDFMEAVVIFSYKMDKWAGGCDSLVVEYRTSADGEWHAMETDAIGSYASVWTQDTVYQLPLPSETYQLAFRGIDRLGRGIQIDNVLVRECPACSIPTVNVANVGKSEALLTWSSGGLDATSYRLRINSSSMDDRWLEDPDYTADILDTVLTNVSNRVLQLKDLSLGTDHYVYIRTLCGRDSSAYSREQMFTTLNTEEIDYIENFNLPYTGINILPPNWYVYNSEDKDIPFIPTGLDESSLADYSPDKTTSLMFGDVNATYGYVQDMPVGMVAYAISPELTGTPLSECQIRFTIQSNATEYMPVVVCVGTEPELDAQKFFDVFTAVDTIEVMGREGFREVIIPLNDCPADAKHIAFYVDVKKKFDFSIEDLFVEKKPACAKATDLKIGIPSTSEIVVSWDGQGATEGEVMFTSEPIADLNKIDESKVIKRTSGTLPLKLEGLDPWTEGYIYARNKCGAEGEGAWSVPVFARTPAKLAGLPVTYDFEDSETYETEASSPSYRLDLTVGLTVLALNGYSTVRVGRPNASHLEGSENGIYTQATAEEYLIFPEMDDVENTRVVLWHASNSGTVHFEVGLMSDINDTSSFTSIAVVESQQYSRNSPAGGYKRAVADLRGYGDKGKFFAVKYSSRTGTHYIDDVEFKKIPNCPEPKDISIEPKQQDAVVTWEANGAAKWQVKVAAEDVYDELYTSTYDKWLFDETVTSPTATVSGLTPGETEYYVYIKPICDGEESEWVTGVPFKTSCQDITTLPYTENFDKYSSNSQSISCYTIYPNFNGGYYSGGSPVIGQMYGRSNYLILQNDTVSYPSYRRGYFIFPRLAVDIKSVMLTMNVAGAKQNGNGYFEVGVVESPEDTASFFPISRVQVAYDQISNVQIYFSKYEGTGEYIAFRMSGGMQYKYEVDDIQITDKAGCPKVNGPAANDVTGTTATLSWSGDVEEKWDLIVSKKALSTTQLDAAFDAGKTDDVVTYIGKGIDSNPYELKEGLFYSTYYFFYVRAICSDTEKGAWSDAGTFRTTCGVLSVDEMHAEDFEHYGKEEVPECWTAGNSQDPESLGSTSLSFPGVSTTSSHSGSNSMVISAIKHDATKFDNGMYLITPEIKTDDISKLQVSFWGYAPYDQTGASQGRVRVGVVTSPENTATFVEQEIVYGYGQWYHYTIPFDRYLYDMDGQKGKMAMFRADFPIEGDFYIDDVEFTEIPKCAAPAHAMVDSLTSDYARLTWAKGSAPYTVRLSQEQLTYAELDSLTEKEELGLVSFENVTDTFIELNDLEKRTGYYAYIGSECGDTMLWSNIIYFETACEVEYPLPYTANFEDAPFTGYYSGPDCWENFYGEERIWFQKCNINTSGHGGGKSLSMVINDARYTSYAVMPKLARPVNETLVSFYAQKSGSSVAQTNVVVGVVSDMTSRETMKNTFVPVDTVLITKDGWNKYYVPMNAYTGNGEHIAFSGSFRQSLGIDDKMKASTYYLDDVMVDTLPSCMFPEYLEINSVTPTDIEMSFTELGDANQWQIACLNAGETPDEDETVLTADATTYTITGLTPSIDYDIYVRSACDAESGDVSPWTGPISQRTAAKSPVMESDYPYNETFEGDISSTWNFASVDTANTWTSGTALTNGEGSKSVYITNDGTAAAYDPTDATSAWAYRTLQLEPGVYTFSYDWISNGDLRVGIIPAEGMFDGGSDKVYYADGTSSSLNGFIAIMGGKNSLSGSEGTTWQSVSDYIIIENEMAGYYHLVFFWTNKAVAGDVISPSAAIDNLKIERSSCVQPLNLYVGRTLSTEADLTWEIVGEKSEYKEWEVYVTDDLTLSSPDDDTDGTKKVFSGKFQDVNALIENLEELTDYNAFVRAVCAEGGDNTTWSEPVKFKTPCNPIPVGTLYDFDDETTMPQCITIGNTEGYAVNSISLKTNSSTIVARNGERAAFISSTYGSSNGSYIALPHIEGSLDNVQLTFWVRPVYHRDGTISFSYSSLTTNSGAMAVTVAAMNDLKDTATYTSIKECIYPYGDEDINRTTKLTEDITGNDWWVKFSVPLKGFDGQYILIHDAHTVKDKNQLYIDSIAVEYVPECVPPTDVKIGTVTDHTVEFSFSSEGEGTWKYRCSTDPKMSNALSGTVTSTSGKIEGLEDGKTYYLSVCRVCEGEESEWTLNEKFQTNYSVRFEERFTEKTNLPNDWTRANGPKVEDWFDNVPETEWDYLELSDMSGWVNVPVSNDASAHQKLKLTAGSAKVNWMFTPTIYMQPDQNAYMTFDLMLTLADSYYALDPTIEQTAMTFMVIISEDGGTTWTQENATTWDAASGTDDLANFYALTNSFKTITMDLSKYKGKSIKVAFYTYPNVAIDLDLHLDNVYINSYETEEISDNVCEECDYVYEPEDIVIRSAEYDMEAAQNVFEVFKVSDDGGSDNLYRFILNVNKMGRSEFYEEICEGNTYDGHGFTGVTSAGTHWRKLAGTGDRCDSVATLHLTVNPLERKEFDATMCAGGKYEWNGNTYTTAGDYTDTVLSVGDGCDTVVTLHLTTIPAMEAERTHYLCEGESLTIDGRTFTSDGSWKEETVEERKAAVEEDGCDSVITHTVIYAQKYDMVIEAAICDGETYNKNGFTAQAERDYHLTETSDLTGCDSLVTLNLLVINPGETEREVTRNITVGQLPYNFYGDEYDENTAPGQYTGEVTVTSESGACSMTVKYTLNVGDIEPGTDNVTEPGELILTPNPVRVHETVMLHLDLTAAERDGLTVSVYGSTGALIERFAPDSEPIVIDGLDAAGVYMVRVTDGLGHVYQGKIIVR